MDTIYERKTFILFSTLFMSFYHVLDRFCKKDFGTNSYTFSQHYVYGTVKNRLIWSKWQTPLTEWETYSRRCGKCFKKYSWVFFRHPRVKSKSKFPWPCMIQDYEWNSFYFSMIYLLKIDVNSVQNLVQYTKWNDSDIV